MTNDNSIDKTELQFESDRLWQYFEYHAKQRTEIFKFYVILSSLIISGSLTLLSGVKFKDLYTCNVVTQDKIIHLYLAATTILGLILMIFSWIFYKLDQRNFTMIDQSRKAMIELERSKDIKNKIFTSVDKITKDTHPYTFSKCFNAIFVIFGLLGGAVFVYSLIKWIPCDCILT